MLQNKGKVFLSNFSNADGVAVPLGTMTTTTTTRPATTTSTKPSTSPVYTENVATYTPLSTTKPSPVQSYTAPKPAPTPVVAPVITPVLIPVPSSIMTAPSGGGGGGGAESETNKTQNEMETKDQTKIVTGVCVLAGATAGYFIAKKMKKDVKIGALIGAIAGGVSGYFTYTKFVLKAGEAKSGFILGRRGKKGISQKVGTDHGTSGGCLCPRSVGQNIYADACCGK